MNTATIERQNNIFKWLNVLLVAAILFLLVHPSKERILLNESGNGLRREFLLGVVAIIMGMSITNLVKGFDSLVKHSPSNFQPFYISDFIGNTSRWHMRLLWGSSLTFLVLQLVWGMRLKLDEVIVSKYFMYYIVLVSLVYSMIVYVFPENIEQVFERERIVKLKNHWSISILERLKKLYVIYGIYLFVSALISIDFIDDQFKDWWKKDLFNVNLVGVVLKLSGVLLVCIVYHEKKEFIKTRKSNTMELHKYISKYKLRLYKKFYKANTDAFVNKLKQKERLHLHKAGKVTDLRKEYQLLQV